MSESETPQAQEVGDGFWLPLSVQLADLRSALEAVETGIREGGCHLRVNTYSRRFEVWVFNPERCGIEGDDWSRLQPIIDHLDYFLLYALDGAPEPVISSWAERGGFGLEHALERIGLARTTLRAFREEWDVKSGSLLPIVAEPMASPGVNMEPLAPIVDVRILVADKSFAGPAMDYELSSQTIRLTRADMTALSAFFEDLLLSTPPWEDQPPHSASEGDERVEEGGES